MKEEDTFAMELLHELKKSSKRNFIIAIILLIALVASNLAWLIYESQYEEVCELVALSNNSINRIVKVYLQNKQNMLLST